MPVILSAKKAIPDEPKPPLPLAAENVAVEYERNKRRKRLKSKIASNLDKFVFRCSVCDFQWRVKCPDAQYKRPYQCPRCVHEKRQMIARQHRAKVLFAVKQWGDLEILFVDVEKGLARCRCPKGHEQDRKFNSIHTQIKCLECDRARKRAEYQARVK